MIFKDYRMPETQKEKYVLAIQAAKEVAKRGTIKKEDHKALIKFLSDIGEEAKLVFLRSIPMETSYNLTIDKDFLHSEPIRNMIDKSRKGEFSGKLKELVEGKIVINEEGEEV